MELVLEKISDVVFGVPTVLLIISAGIYFTLRLNFLQIFGQKQMFKTLAHQFGDKKGAFSLVATSLSATVGTGSVIGVAAAISVGGAGAVFWMWISAFLGMGVAYAEGVLSIKYREATPNGFKGGMMIALRDGLKSPRLAAVYAVLGALASLGMGSMAQTSSFASSLKGGFCVPPWISAVFCALTVAVCLFSKSGSAKKICSVFLPLLAVGFTALSLGVIAVNIENVPRAVKEITASAFGLRPIVGSAVGYSVKQAVTVGFKRGIFSNEAGLGTTASVHAGAQNVTPHEQGLLNMFEVTVDTFVICTLTALVILLTNSHLAGVSDTEMISLAFGSAFGNVSKEIVSVCVAGFALATAIGWSQIGSSCFEYISRGKFMRVYDIVYISAAFMGCLFSIQSVFTLSDIFNGLMAVPCMTALMLLSGDVIKACPSSQNRFRPFRSSREGWFQRRRGK